MMYSAFILSDHNILSRQKSDCNNESHSVECDERALFKNTNDDIPGQFMHVQIRRKALQYTQSLFSYIPKMTIL